MSTYDPAYSKKWRLDRHRGHTRYTDPTRARNHIATLLAAGASMRAIADAAGTSPSVISRINKGDQKHLRRPTEAGILAVTIRQLHHRDHGDKFVPDLGARRRIRALMTLGHSHADIAEAAGWGRNSTTVANVLHQQGSWITKTKHDALVAAYRALATRPGTSSRTRLAAEKRGYPGPLCWDDIDDPYAEPDTDTGQPEDGRSSTLLDDLEHLLDVAGPWTWAGITARLHVTRSAIEHACGPDRGNRPDLLARITTHSQKDAA